VDLSLIRSGYEDITLSDTSRQAADVKKSQPAVRDYCLDSGDEPDNSKMSQPGSSSDHHDADSEWWTKVEKHKAGRIKKVRRGFCLQLS